MCRRGSHCCEFCAAADIPVSVSPADPVPTTTEVTTTTEILSPEMSGITEQEVPLAPAVTASQLAGMAIGVVIGITLAAALLLILHRKRPSKSFYCYTDVVYIFLVDFSSLHFSFINFRLSLFLSGFV